MAAMTPVTWGRYGADDERGAANLLSPACVQRALSCVATGRVYSLALPLTDGGGPLATHRAPMRHYMTRAGSDYAAGLPERGAFGFADDVITVATHGTTHLDALAHVWQEGLMYNGFPATEVTSIGARRCGIDKTGPIVTRALIVDLVPEGRPWLEPGEAVGVDRLVDLVGSLGVAPEPGDALLLRTGWIEHWRSGTLPDVGSWPGLHPDCGAWIAEREFVLVGADNMAVEVGPSPLPGEAAPMHVELIRGHGIYLMELVDLAELVASGSGTGLLAVNPLRIERGAGSPVAPLVVV
jgi:kynurenine formamidase